MARRGIHSAHKAAHCPKSSHFYPAYDRCMTQRISRDDVAHVARLARLHLGAILEHAARVAALDTHDVPPTAHPLALENVLRDDVPVPSLDRDEVLAQAPAVEDGRFLVPRILAEEP